MVLVIKNLQIPLDILLYLTLLVKQVQIPTVQPIGRPNTEKRRKAISMRTRMPILFSVVRTLLFTELLMPAPQLKRLNGLKWAYPAEGA